MTQRPTTVRYRVLAWLTLAAAISYVCRNAVGVAESTIREDLGLTLEQSGWFMGAFFWAYAVFQVPSGWFSQCYGTRIALALFALLWSGATLGIGFAPGFWLLIVAQLVMGVAQAGVFPAACNSIGHWLPLAERSRACGILAAGMQLGAITASALTGVLMAPFGWRWAFAVFALPGLVWAMRFYSRFRDRPEEAAGVDTHELELIRRGRAHQESDRTIEAKAPAAWAIVASNPVIWLLCCQQACRAAGYMFFASWFPTFLQQTRGVSIQQSGLLQCVVLTGTMLGSISGGILTDWIWRRTGNLRLSRSGVAAASLCACSLLILGAWYIQSAALAVVLLAVGSLFAALAGPCALAATIDIGGPRVPQVFGLMNMCGNFAAAACPVVVGAFFRWTTNWNLVLLLFAGIYFFGAMVWAGINLQRHPTGE